MTDPPIHWRAEMLFDRRCYDLLDQQTGGAASEVAALYRQSAPARKQAMMQAVAAGQARELARLAHLVKGGSKTLGLMRLAELCEMIERAQQSDHLDLPAAGVAIDAEFDAALAALGLIGRE